MAYLTQEYYEKTFHGTHVQNFERLAEIASDVIDAIVFRPITDETDKDMLAKATAYQLEYIHQQGGEKAATGFAASQMTVTESLDDYSITQAQSDDAKREQLSLNGIPVSPLALAILKRLGLMSRWFYSGRGDELGY